jgi:2-polyprenyl-6-methoxyphenol hydroxylase-like FAD-dependent oxidoreductase
MVEALVVGAGIGGLAAALALRRNGLGVRVFEQAADPRQLGFALLLAPNAMSALRELGLADEVRAQGMVLERGEMRRPDGKVLRRFDAAKVSAALGEDTVCVLRPVLHGALLGALGSDVLELGTKVTGFRASEAGVTLELEQRPAVAGKVLIGADGVGSVIRQRLHPDDPPPRRRGLRAYRGVARNAAQHLGGLSGVQYFGRGLEAGASRANAEDVYWFLCVRSPEPPPNGDVRSQLDPDLAAFHAPFRALVAATRDDVLRADELYERQPLARWGEGAVSLLGDAAHPMLPHAGQGAAQALEDAVALGNGLRAHRFVEQALRRYEQVRIPRTRTIVELARRNARMGSLRGALGCWLRDLAVQRLPERTLLRSMIDLGRPPSDPGQSDAPRDSGAAA